jgi:glycyl-tRNA synthetase beta chain
MSRRDLLVEIGTEELPPRALQELADAFLSGIVQGLASANLRHARSQRFATPRRLAVLVKGLAEQQPEQEIKRRGPPIKAAFDASGAPTRAAMAFAESCGSSVHALERVQDPKGEFLFFSGRKPGAPARDLIPGIVQASLDALPIPKRMRWGAGDVEFVRPVHWVLLLFGKEVLPGRILGIEPAGVTFGHRFHAPKPLRVSSPGSYLATLRKRGFVIADFAERSEKIRADVASGAAATGGVPVWSDSLLDEVTALVEWPVPLAGRFEPRFLGLPREVLIATLQDHQRYFPIQKSAADGTLLAQFIAVANIESRDPAQVRAGNERVVRPRLSDAAFFYESDLRQSLAARVPDLAKVTFQTRLGSLGDKRQRLQGLVGEIAPRIGADRGHAERAAELCKADLLTAMVGEFPELQGTMGRYYARHDGEPEEVAAAIAEHYWPRFAGDALPATRAGMALAVADKIDTIVGIFAIDQKPSGTRDPFGVRRAALGLLRILIEQRLDLDLPWLIARTAHFLQQWSGDVRTVASSINDSVYDYVMERLRAYYLDGAGGFTVTTEMFDAVLVNRPASPLDFDARLRALAAFLALDASASLAAANKRIANILRKAEGTPAAAIRIDLLNAEAEKRLHASLAELRPQVEPLLEQRSYGDAMQKLASLRTPVDAFFDSVMVMDPDAALRANRLALLNELRQLFLRTADLSRLPG